MHYEDQQKKLTLKEIYKRIFIGFDYYYSRIFKRFTAVHPDNNYNFCLQILEVLVIVACILCYSLYIFYNYYHKEFYFYLNIVSLVVFVLSMF